MNAAKKSLRESKAYDLELRFVYGKLLAEVYFRIDNGMQAFFRRAAEGEKARAFILSQGVMNPPHRKRRLADRFSVFP